MVGMLKAQAAYHGSFLLLLDTIMHPPCFERTCIRDNNRFASRKTYAASSESNRLNEPVSRCCIVVYCCACGHVKTIASQGLLATTPSLRPYHGPQCKDMRNRNAPPLMERDCSAVFCIHDASITLLRDQCDRKGDHPACLAHMTCC
jgi:hypothetical protein